MILPFLLLGAGAATLLAIALTANIDTPPNHPPDLPPAPGSTRYKRVDAILGELKKAAQSSGVPLGLLIGWIAKESGGKLDDVTRLDERGLFQLMPDESKRLGLDHQRLSTDLVYSINAGLLLIAIYMKDVDALAVTPKGTAYYWRLVKLAHTMGSGAMKTIVNDARAVGQAGSWDALEQYALANNAQLLHETKHSPSKWFPFIDQIYALGAPWGFGSDTQVVVGGMFGSGSKPPAFTDIPDPLDIIQPRR